MNLTLLMRHTSLLGVSFGVLVLACLLCFINGSLKPADAIEWLDVVGEGSVAVLTMIWIVAVLTSRPPGKVTSLLVVGLSCFMFSALLDVFDEFNHYNQAAMWLSMVESVPAGLGMIIMSLALYLWHQEQLALNRQLQRRELWYRSHDQIDVITQLYRADYWRARAQELQEQGISASVIILDINNFSQFNQQYGQQEGDRFLREIAQLILMNLRAVDLACRYAGDRFVLLLPEIAPEEARRLAEQLQQSVRHVAFKAGHGTTAIFQSVRVVAGPLDNENRLNDILARMNQKIDEMAVNVA